MWKDSETEIDYLDFSYIVEIMKDTINDEKLLPSCIGLYGDWGSGKSSLMHMCKKQLEEQKDGTVCLLFNGWLYESYDDAKTAILASILDGIKEGRELSSAAKITLKALYDSIDKFKVIKGGIKFGIDMAVTGGFGAITNLAIKEIAKKYELPMYVNTGKTSIADDWNFAVSCVDTDLVTLAHQDDIYEKNYLKYILAGYKKAENPIILFTDYGELRNNKIVLKNKLLVIKRMLLFILRCPAMWNNILVRRRILSLGSAICCPAVTLNKKMIEEPLFENNMKSNIDWQAWEKLSRKRGAFVYIPKKAMFHRIHEESTTSKILEDCERRNEDLIMFRKFWPEFIAKMIEKIYQKSEKSNKIVKNDNE